MSDIVWIIDTSSIAEIRRKIPGVPERKAIFLKLDEVAASGALVFPQQVLDELERGRYKDVYDHGFEWTKRHAHRCKRNEPLHAHVREVLSDPQIRRVLDPDKDHEEADPYILALAIKLRESGFTVGVITEDVKTRPDKLGLKDACGLLMIPSISVLPYLEQQGIWPLPSEPAP